jgi:multiple sugar transport system ATP-binding protein
MSKVRVINLEKVFKSFLRKDTIAVKQVNMEVKDKDFVTILGPSGCGKTTLLRLIAGLEEPTEGEIYFNDLRVDKVPPQKRNISMVFQNYAIFPHMNVERNIGYGLKLNKVPKDKIRRTVRDTARILGLEDLLEHKPAQLSGGQRQRVALGRAIIRKPKVFLMDEPLSNLDAALRDQMRVEIKGLHQRLQATTIYVTHDQIEALSMSDRIAVMNKGQIEQYDEPRAVFESPAHIFVAQFIGTPPMNLIHGELAQEKEKLCVKTKPFCLPISTEKASLVRQVPGKKVVVGVRPQVIRLSEKSNKSMAMGRVSLNELIGTECILHLQIEDISVKVVTRKTGRGILSGDTVGISFHLDDVHIFDQETGKSIIHGL